MAQEIAADINRERAARHLPSIPVDADYNAGAQRVAERNRDQPCHACHSSDHPSGEVVWWGSDYPSSGSPIWWMGSPPHRALLLAPNATRLGVGVACNGTEHDAVAWIETQAEAENASPNPVATKAGTGSRCTGAPVTPTTRFGAPVSSGAAPPPTAAPRVTTTARAAGGTTTTPRRAVTAAASPAASTPVTSGGHSPFSAAAMSSRPAETLLEQRVAGSLAVSTGASKDVGVGMTIGLVATFIGVLALGRLARRMR